MLEGLSSGTCLPCTPLLSRAWRTFAAVIATAFLLTSCASTDQIAKREPEKPPAKPRTVQANPKVKATFRRPKEEPPVRPDNPVTEASIALGRKLFEDNDLSRNRTLACSSCHIPSAAWADRIAKPIADNGQPMTRRSQTILDVAWQDVLLWDGRFDALEAFVPAPIASPHIMGLPMPELVERLAARADYVSPFEQAYPGRGITGETVSKALSNYMRTIRSPATRFDAWVEGDGKALTTAEARGFVLFTGKAKCSLCHSGWRFTDQGFRDIGLPDDVDLGRGKIMSEIASMAHAFKTPTLRGVAERAPYMHDGSLRSLEEVVDHYDRGGIRRPSLSPDMTPLALTASEKADIVAFLKTLSAGGQGPVETKQSASATNGAP